MRSLRGVSLHLITHGEPWADMATHLYEQKHTPVALAFLPRTTTSQVKKIKSHFRRACTSKLSVDPSCVSSVSLSMTCLNMTNPVFRSWKVCGWIGRYNPGLLEGAAQRRRKQRFSNTYGQFPTHLRI